MTEQITEQLPPDGIESLAPVVENGIDVLDAKIFSEIHAFIIENYISKEEDLIHATMALCALGATLKKDLGLTFEIEVADE